MDYEKKYKEALERAKELHGTVAAGRDFLAEIFPELTESEDERIRQSLLAYIKGESKRLDTKKWIAYLEKQKEQKPVEWGEFDKGALKDAICAADILGNDESFNKGNPNLAKAFRVAKDWLESLPARFILQPKIEWSEEDEKLFWGLTAYVPKEELKRLGVTRDDILKKLKSIRLQPIQLKEAYIEGFDTARHATALAFMNYCDKIRPNGKMCLSNGECEEIEKAFLVGDWEKIERYFHKCHWNPSEEQIEALEYVIRDYREDGCNATANYLQEILDHLKNM